MRLLTTSTPLSLEGVREIDTDGVSLREVWGRLGINLPASLHPFKRGCLLAS